MSRALFVAPRVRVALLCLALVAVAGAAWAQAPAPLADAAAPAAPVSAPPARVYGLEVETRGDTQRLLVFADGDVTPRLEQPDENRVVLILPRAALDSSAPRRVRPGRGGAIRLATATEQRSGSAPEVRIEVHRAPGAIPSLEQRGSALALAFEGGAPQEKVSIAIDDEMLNEVVDRLAKISGVTVMYDETLQGRVSIASTVPVTPEEVRAILDTVLLMEGFAAIPTPGGPLRIMPLQDGRGQAPFRPVLDDPDSERLVTTFVRLQHVDARSISSLLQPWLGRSALAVTQPETNGLILAASQQRLHQLLRVVQILDQAAAEELMVRRLRHRSAEDLGALLEAAVGDEGPAKDLPQIWVDARTNTLLLKAPAERLEELRRWIDQLDRPPPAEGGLHVYKVRYADPEALATLLNEVGSGSAEAAGPAAGPFSGGSFSAVADPPTHSLVIRADPEVYGVVLDLLGEIDVLPPRIEVEVVVMEVATDSALQLGFDAFLPFTDPNSPDDWIANAFLDPTGSGLLQPGSGTGPSFAARFARTPVIVPIIDSMGNPIDLIVPRETFVFQADAREVQSRILLRPHLSMLSGEEHEIHAGNNIPIPQGAVQEGDGAAFQQRTNIVRQDVGVRLRVKPTLGLAGRVRLELDVEASRVTDSLAGDPEVVGATIEERQVTSNFWLSDDEVAVVGMGHFSEYFNMETGTPWLRDIPLIGWLFKAVRERKMDANLLITAQARILDSDAEMLANSIRRRLALERILSREGHLVPADGPYALRVATRSDAGDAEAIAATLEATGERTRVVSWVWEGVERWDVYMVGIEEAKDIPEASLRASRGGWTPELVVVDGAPTSS